MKKSADKILAEMAETFRQRNQLYGNNYHRYGAMMVALFPKGLTLTTVDEWNRLALLMCIQMKVSRYAQQFTKGGHVDSAHDAAVYAAMLEELTSIT